MKTAIVIGSTGLVGKQIISQLLENPNYQKVISFSRKSIGIANSRLVENLVNFNSIEDWKDLITGDDLYSAMGTTIKKAGSKDMQYKIDYTFQYKAAKAAKENGVKNYGLVSAAGADAQSKMFYNRIKGELDDSVLALNFDKTCIVRPSFLDGNRNESRPAEFIGLKAFNVLGLIPGISKYRPIKDTIVAQALIKNLNTPEKGQTILSLNEIREYLHEV